MLAAAARRVALRTPGLHRLRRPATTAPAEAADALAAPQGHTDPPAFDLTYVRTGPTSQPPIVVIPGGPGLASVLPYRWFRARAAARGLDVIMVEHRGVGLSRTDLAGRDLPAAAMRVEAAVDDIAAVLDAEGVERAVVFGSSYGGYVAAGLGVRHPSRVVAMVLDSPMLSITDPGPEREMLRATLWRGENPAAATAAAAVRRLIAAGVDETDLLVVARAAYELGGPDLADRLLTARLAGRGRLAWRLLHAYADRAGATRHRRPFLYEFDLVAALAFRQLHYAPEPDGKPFDAAVTYADAAPGYPAFAGEPFHLDDALPGFTWPTVVLTGEHDLRTPPAGAERAARLLPHSLLLRLANGHSALESHPEVVLHVLARVQAGRWAELADEGELLARLPRRGPAARLPRLVELALRLDEPRG